MSSIITGDWFHLGRDLYFRKMDLYNMEWSSSVDIENMVICPASYGGPIAVVRDRKKLVKVQQSGKPVIAIFTSSGVLLSSINWNSGQLIHLGWSSEEHLLCIRNDGQVLIYDMTGTMIHKFSMGEEVSVTGVMAAKLFPSSFGTGLAVLTNKYRVFLVNSVVEPKVRQYPPMPRTLMREAPMGWEIISERSTSVLLSTGKELTLLREGEHPVAVHPDFSESCTGFIDLCVSLDSRHLAVLSDTGILWLGSSDLKNKYCEVSTNCTSCPKQLVWCGADGVIGYWNHEILIISRFGETVTIPCLHPVYLVPEIDGVRTISSFNHELIQKVPQVTQKLFTINSTEAGSYLFEASKQFLKKSHTAYDYIHLVGNQLDKAIEQCIEGAGYEFNTEIQKNLLKAAKLGRTFAPDAHGKSFVNMCRLLRALNAVRAPKIGIPLTYSQVNFLGLRVFLDRLISRKFYKMAIDMAEYLDLPEEEGSGRILAHWASYKVKQSHLNQEEVALQIAKKFKNAGGISYSAVAAKAAESGKPELAIKLLGFEPKTSLQVPLLLRLNQGKLALERALECGDTDLVLFVMTELRESMSLGDFQLLIRSHPLAQNLYLKYCRFNAPDTLRDIYMQEDDFLSQADCFLKDYFDRKNSTLEISLNSAAECYSKAKDDFSAALCRDHLKLIKYQRTFESQFERDFIDKSLHETVHKLLIMKEIKLAEKLRNEFKMPDNHYWRIRIQTLAEQKDWAELERFSNSKKSPIGYEPFVDICLSHGEKVEAQKYLPRVRDEFKVKYLVKLGSLAKAAEVAFEQKDPEALRFILSNGGQQDRTLAEKIDSYLKQLK